MLFRSLLVLMAHEGQRAGNVGVDGESGGHAGLGRDGVVVLADPLLGLARFRSTHGDGLVSLTDYVGRMKEGQKAIYYITGGEGDAVARSPQIEGFRSRGIEVLLLTDPVDEFWVPMVGTFEDHPFKSATQGGADFDAVLKSQITGPSFSSDTRSSTPTKGIPRSLPVLGSTSGTSKDVSTSRGNEIGRAHV